MALVALIWFIGCPLAGAIAAEIGGNFGSIGFVVVGLYVGVLGGIAQALLIRSRVFLRISYHLQVLTAMVMPLLVLVWGAVEFEMSLSALVLFFPSLAFAGVAAWTTAKLVRRVSVPQSVGADSGG